jgi:hypothetical protein
MKNGTNNERETNMTTTTQAIGTTYYAIVTFGRISRSAPRRTFASLDAATAARWRWCDEDTTGLRAADSRIYGYASRREAKLADISDGIGSRGRVE